MDLIDVIPGVSTDQIDALGSILAGALTPLAIFIAWRGLRAQLNAQAEQDTRRDEERRDAEAQQARLVHAATTGNLLSGQGEGRFFQPTLAVWNRSNAPITDVLLMLDDAGDPLRISSVPPRGEKPLPNAGPKLPADWGEKHPGHSVTISFTDANGLRWRRTGHDQPVKLMSVGRSIDLLWGTSAPPAQQ